MVNNIAVSSGSGKADFEKLNQILNTITELNFVCLDVANGYSEHFVEFVRSVRDAFPQHVIMVRPASRMTHVFPYSFSVHMH